MTSTSLARLLGVRVRAARAHAGLTRGDLGELVGKTGRAIAYWETGERVPGLVELCQLAAFCDVTLAFLLLEVDEKREAIAREAAA